MKLVAIRGAARLAGEAVIGMSHVVEGMHRRVSNLAPAFGRTPERPARGIAGFVYRTVRGGTALAAAAVDRSLAGIEQLLRKQGPADDADTEGRTRAALLSALNGVVGDHLERTGNPLALPMQLRPAGSRGARIVVLVHGLCMNDLQWLHKGHDHGAALERELGWSPVYVRYNTGRHVSLNGLDLALQLEELARGWPAPVQEIAIVGHSMGGLVARSAVHIAQEHGLAWRGKLHHLVHLGTPHHGAVLERAGGLLQSLLEVSPYVGSLGKLAAIRSDGIKDLHHGNVLDADWATTRPGQRDGRTPVPLPVDVHCHAVAGTLGDRFSPGMVGDGLVSVDSALGRHRSPSRSLRFPAGNVLLVPGAGHLDLLGDARVARQLAAWLRPR